MTPTTENTEEESGDSEQHLGIVGFLRAVLPFFGPYKLSGLVIVGCMLIDLAYVTLTPILFEVLIDKAIEPHDTRMLTFVLSALAAGAVLATSSSFLQDVAYSRIGIAVMNDIRFKMFSHLQELSAGYYSRTQVGDIMSRFSNDVASVENGLIWYLPTVIGSIASLVVSAGLLFRLEWRLALPSLIGLTAAFWLAKRLENKANTLNYQLKEDMGGIAVVVQENLVAQMVIKGFNLQDQQREHFRAKLKALRTSSQRANWTGFFMARIPNVGALLMGFSSLGLGAFFVFRGQMTVGELVAFYTLFSQMTTSVTSLTYAMPTLLEGAAGMERLLEVLDETPAIRDGDDAEPLAPLARTIELEGITFGYTDETTSLKDVSLTVQKGAYVAFVGASGSGKSTVLNLVDRFYDPREGTVRYDGRDLREVTTRALRAQLGIVFQDSILFDTTIRENIRMGRLDATEEEIEAAAKKAEIHDFIQKLPKGYATPVGERGGKLSGGQRQRVAIARALVRNPSILILDEATSALDPTTEASVNETIRKLAHDHTILSVTHRLAPVVHCDRIFVLDQGKLVEQGTHDQLLAKDGAYAKLWSKQNGFTISEGGERAEITAERLAAVPLFSTLDAETLADLAREMSSESRQPGAELIREGEHGHELFIVARGRLEVLKKAPDGRQERVDIFDDGDYFGEISLLKNVPRTATVRALTPVTYLSLKRDHFLRLIEKVPGMRESLEAAIEARLQENAIVEQGGAGVVDER